MSSSYKIASTAANRMLYDLYSKEKVADPLVLFIPTTMMSSIPASIQYSFSATAGIARKRGTKSGRVTCNYSSDNKRGGLMNTPCVKESVKKLYGDIHPITTDELMKMVIQQSERVGWKDLILWKMDLKGAFKSVVLDHPTGVSWQWNSRIILP
jgi:hypothetical protein